ncbi:MAG: 5'-methylthioadenosine/adenosylhomocysteine nucleosidase [Mycobacterium sp.]|nr:5'-methylthioadenosine/adenosylhomocysteine nucleosidase [Mycobacterium sp.]
MTIGLICAIPQELAHLREVLDTAEVIDAGHAQFARGTLDGHEVVLVGAGMGKVNAAVVTTLLADRFGCRAVLLSGVAGGLDPRLAIGDVVVAERVVQCDAGMIEDERLLVYQAGHVAFFNATDRLGYDADAGLLNRVRDRLAGFALPPMSRAAGGQDRPPHIVYGTVLTGDQYLHCETTRQRLHAELGGTAIEMEGGAVAQACESFGVPWLVIRALSDLAGSDAHLDFAAFGAGAAAVSAAILRRILPVI